MLCDTARALGLIRRLGELPHDDRAELDAHLDGCPACAEWCRAEAAFDDQISRMMHLAPVPPGLRQDVTSAALLARRRHLLRRRAGLFASVVGLLGMAGVAYWGSVPTPKAIDLPRFAEQIETALNQPQADAEAFLAKHGVTAFRPERPFDFAKLVAHGTEVLDGRDVPVLTFRNPESGAVARVYVLPPRRYAVKSAPIEPISTAASGMQFQVLRDRDDPTRAYLVMFSGDGLDAFRPPSQGA